jgi:GrpB protein
MGLGGHLTEGGIIGNVQPIGARSVPGLAASREGWVDIAVEVWPFPLTPEAQAAVEALGYESVPTMAGDGPQLFRHPGGTFQLFFVELGNEWWQDAIVLRDYLRSEATAREIYLIRKQELAAGSGEKAHLFQDLLGPARAWWQAHYGFGPLMAVVEEMAGFARPWHISSGWALDLFLGRVTRVHHDVDVEIARVDSLILQQHLLTRGWKFVTPNEGKLEVWQSNTPLELPRHQGHAHRNGAMIDVLFTEMDEAIWHYRRMPSVIRTIERASLRTSSGIPYLAPELVLLFKSRSTQDRPKDQVDFERVYEHLELERRAWLKWALTATDPTHRWLGKLN